MNKTEIGNFALKIADRLVSYYQNNKYGAIPEFDDQVGTRSVHWFESGIMWSALSDYQRILNNNLFIRLLQVSCSF
jgi:hypothetical protein